MRQPRNNWDSGIPLWMSSRKDGLTVKKMIAAMVLGAFLVAVGVGCGGPTSPAKPAAPSDKKDEKKEKM